MTGRCATSRRRSSRSLGEKDHDQTNYNDDFTERTFIYTPPINTKEIMPCLCSDDALGIGEIH